MHSTTRSWHSQARRRVLPAVVALTAFSLGLVAKSALASCVALEPDVVWSYPAQGDTGVPTNVDLWLTTAGWGNDVSVSSDGVTLTQLDHPFGYDLGELQPNTTYTLQVATEPGPVPSVPLAPPFEITFTTGAGPVSADPAAEPMPVATSRSRADQLSELCEAVINTQDCFDTGQDTYFHFAPSGTAAAWLITSRSIFRTATLWPAECGDPRIFLGRDAEPCATVSGIDPSGTLHVGEEVCIEATPTEAADPGPDAGQGTQVTANSSPPAPDRSVEVLATAMDEPAQSSSAGGCDLGPSLARPSAPWYALIGLIGLAGLQRRRPRSTRNQSRVVRMARFRARWGAGAACGSSIPKSISSS